jgi:hypothetical protein
MHAEHADVSVRLQDRRSCIRYERTRVDSIESQAETRFCPHPLVLRASPASAAKIAITDACPIVVAGRRRRGWVDQSRRALATDGCDMCRGLLECGAIWHGPLPQPPPARGGGDWYAGIFTLSWCPRAGWGTALKFLLCGAADRCWRTHCEDRAPHTLPALRLGTARYGTPSWLRPTAALR